MSDKPTPINRDKFLNNLQDSYQIPEQSLQPYDNSNPDAKFTKPGQPEFTRANEISMKGDTTNNINISLEDHDETILYYIQNNIKPTVEINGYQREVPVIYGSPERWKSIQKDGFYRDKNGKIQAPVIILKRESFEKNRGIGNKLDGNKVNNVQYFKQGYSKRNSYDNFSVLTNQIPAVEYKVGIIPDYITITYKLTIFTDYVEHMNKLIEAIEFASDSYWGDKERFMFRASITSFPTPIVVESGDDRVSRSDLTLTVQGYIIPDTVNAFQASPTPKSFNVTKLLFKEFFEEAKPIERNVPVGSKRINISNPSQPLNNGPTYYYGNFSGSFYGDGSHLINLPFPSGSNINTGSFVLTSSFNLFTSSYNVDSSSFDFRINNITSSVIDTSSLVTTSSFNQFTSSYNNDSSSFDFRINGINIDTGSLLLSSSFNIFTSSYNIDSASFSTRIDNTGSFITTSQTSSMSVLSSSYAETSSYVLGGGSQNLQSVINNGDIITYEDPSGIILTTTFNSFGYNNTLTDISSSFVSYTNIGLGWLEINQQNDPNGEDGGIALGVGYINSVKNGSNFSLISGFGLRVDNNLGTGFYVISPQLLDNNNSCILNAPNKNGTFIIATIDDISTGSFVFTSSFNQFTASYNTGSFQGDLMGTSSWSNNSISSSYSSTSSYAPNYVLNSSTSSFITNNQTSSFVLNIVTSSMLQPYVLISSTSSMSVLSSSHAISSSRSVTSSFADNSLTSSFASTSSYAPNYVLISNTSSMSVLSSSQSISSSYATTASFALNAGGSINTSSFATTGSNIFQGNQTISGSLFISGTTTSVNNHINYMPQTILNDTVNSSTVTGVVANTLIASYLIPANTFSSGDKVEMNMMALKNGVNAASTFIVNINASSSLSGATRIGGITGGSANNRNYHYHRTLTFKSSTTFETLLTTLNNGNDFGVDNNALSTVTFNTAVDNYLVISVTPSNASDSHIISRVSLIRNRLKQTV